MIADVWYVGVTLCIASNALSPLGYILQKRSAQQRRSAGGGGGGGALSSQWLFGCGLVLLSILLGFVSSAFTAQSILAPLSSISLIVNMVASALLLGEKVTRLNLLSAVLIVVGSVLSVVFGDHSDSVYTNAGLISNFRSVAAILYTSLSAAFCLLVYLLLRLQLWHSHAAASTERGSRQNSVRRDMLHALLFCVLAGASGAQSDLFGKMVVELISSSAQGDQQLLSPYPYLYLAAMLAFAAIQIHFLSHGLVLSDALFCLPFYQCVEILTSTVGAALLFGELDGSSTKQLLAFIAGLVSLLAGVAVMTLRDYSGANDGSDAVSSARRSARQSVHNTATMLAQLNVRRWKVTRVRDEEEDDVAGAAGKARSGRSKSQSEWELLQSTTRVQREKQLVGSVGARALSLYSTGQLRLSQEVELSVMQLSQPPLAVPAVQSTSPISGRATVTAPLSRSHTLPTYFFTSVAAEAELSASRSAGPGLISVALSPLSEYRSSDRWAHAPTSSGSVSLLSPVSRRAAVSRDDVEPMAGAADEGQHRLSVLEEECSEVSVPPPAASVTQKEGPSTRPLLRIVRVSRVAPSPGRHKVSRSISAAQQSVRHTQSGSQTNHTPNPSSASPPDGSTSRSGTDAMLVDDL